MPSTTWSTHPLESHEKGPEKGPPHRTAFLVRRKCLHSEMKGFLFFSSVTQNILSEHMLYVGPVLGLLLLLLLSHFSGV